MLGLLVSYMLEQEEGQNLHPVRLFLILVSTLLDNYVAAIGLVGSMTGFADAYCGEIWRKGTIILLLVHQLPGIGVLHG